MKLKHLHVRVFFWLILKQIRAGSANARDSQYIRICRSTLICYFPDVLNETSGRLELPFQVPKQFFFPRFILLGKRIVRVKVGMFQTYLVCLFLSPLFPLFHIIRIFGLTSCTSPAKQLKLGCTPKLTNQHLDNPDNNLLFLFGIRPICLCIGEIINFQFFFQLLQKCIRSTLENFFLPVCKSFKIFI